MLLCPPLIPHHVEASDWGRYPHASPPQLQSFWGFPHLLIPFMSSHLTIGVDGRCHLNSLELPELSVLGAKACLVSGTTKD